MGWPCTVAIAGSPRPTETHHIPSTLLMATILLIIITALPGRDGLSASTPTLYMSNYGRGGGGVQCLLTFCSLSPVHINLHTLDYPWWSPHKTHWHVGVWPSMSYASVFPLLVWWQNYVFHCHWVWAPQERDLTTSGPYPWTIQFK